MSTPMVIGRERGITPRRRLAARVMVAAARPLAALPPRRLRGALKLIRAGARPATAAQVQEARDAVVVVSTRCAGQYCLQRSVATALLCRLAGTWPTWRAGVATAPFRAHAWVEADGEPIGEPHPAGFYTPTLTVGPSRLPPADPARTAIT